MRVLHIGKYYPPFAGGIEHFLADLLPALQRRGIAGAAVVHDEQRGRQGRYPGPADDPAIYRAPCHGQLPVSYTHLDVYKRQSIDTPAPSTCRNPSGDRSTRYRFARREVLVANWARRGQAW